MSPPYEKVGETFPVSPTKLRPCVNVYVRTFSSIRNCNCSDSGSNQTSDGDNAEASCWSNNSPMHFALFGYIWMLIWKKVKFTARKQIHVIWELFGVGRERAAALMGSFDFKVARRYLPQRRWLKFYVLEKTHDASKCSVCLRFAPDKWSDANRRKLYTAQRSWEKRQKQFSKVHA